MAAFAAGLAGTCAIVAVSGATAAVGPTDLSLTKSDNPDPITVGNNLAYTITVKNTGAGAAADASSVIVSDPLPSTNDVTFVSSSTSQGSCSKAGNTVNCNLGTVLAGDTATVTIVVKTRRAGTLSNTATVASPEDTTTPANNSDTETTTVNSAATTTPKAPKTKKPKTKKGKASCAAPTIVGTEGDDSISGTSGPDVILSLGGNDQIFAGGGNDLVCAGAGFDFVFGDRGGDTIIGGAQADRLVGGDGGDLLKGKNGRDRLNGQRGNDVLDGGRKHDRCRGGSGHNLLMHC